MQIIKRNGQVAEFDPDKIYQAILKAAQTVYVLDDINIILIGKLG